jgi:hypothetical protein
METPKISIICTPDGKYKIYKEINRKKTTIQSDECIDYGQTLIQNYLELKGMIIRPLTIKDVKNLNADNKLRSQLCGENLEDMLSILIDDINYLKPKNCHNFVQDDDTIRLTYVLSHKNNKNNIVGLVSGIINYSDGSTPEILKNIDGVYVELGCSNQANKNHSAGTNYFIRAFVLLESFRYKSVRNLWGSASGEIGGDNKVLRNLHIKRKCAFYEDTKIYYCDPIEFLNEFFRRIYIKDLLLYTESF